MHKPIVIPPLSTIPIIATPPSQKRIKSARKKYFKKSPSLGESGALVLPLTEDANGVDEATTEEQEKQPETTGTPTENAEPALNENDLTPLKIDEKVEIQPAKDLFDFLGESETTSEKRDAENEETGPIDTMNETVEPDTHTDESTDTASHHDTLSVSEPPVSDASVTPSTPLFGATPLTPTTLRKKKKSKIKRQIEKMMNEDTNPLRSTEDKKVRITYNLLTMYRFTHFYGTFKLQP